MSLRGRVIALGFQLELKCVQLGSESQFAPRGCTAAQKKSRTIKMARDNAYFSEVVSAFKKENTQVAGTGFELLVRFRGKTYVLTKAGDQLGIISEKARS